MESTKKHVSVKEGIISAIDENHNGEIDIEDIIIKGLKTPGIRINRFDFLRKEFALKYPADILDRLSLESPVAVGISNEDIEKVATETIKFERNCVSGISALLGTPGGWAMVATIPADIIQYYAYMLRAAQKLMYLYGFPEIIGGEAGNIDTTTINLLVVCLGVMYGVAGAKNALLTISKALGKGVEKQLLSKALTKGAVYPIVKKVAKWFGVKMTKEVFAGFFNKAIPVVGGIAGGVITYVSFKPCCEKLKEALKENTSAKHDCLIEGDDLVLLETAESTTNTEE